MSQCNCTTTFATHSEINPKTFNFKTFASDHSGALSLGNLGNGGSYLQKKRENKSKAMV